ncbi:hypothetical protein BDK51DRAFT_27122 [Blyttiomyces helicus]|uniref:Uncharacterized protein n=1 Tax=Blyttiomyces helicus TaxID=388810 RepID=A0A4P9W9A7_9FUNG|nr:hypothetical protein BDK51DRAFT_27122 [Blyttiomyces helicus]|eukprot:RKO88063.1 hypothetical protein BDK51DRAFT_27122 [Blyttiomyces helicus]
MLRNHGFSMTHVWLDNGELVSKVTVEFLLGMSHLKTSPHTPEQNQIAKHFNGTVVQLICALMAKSSDLRVFGSIHVEKTGSCKDLDPRAINRKGYRVRGPIWHKVLESRNVAVDKNRRFVDSMHAPPPSALMGPSLVLPLSTLLSVVLVTAGSSPLFSSDVSATDSLPTACSFQDLFHSSEAADDLSLDPVTPPALSAVSAHTASPTA